MKNLLALLAFLSFGAPALAANDPAFQVQYPSNTVNGVEISGVATGGTPSISSFGTDTNVGLTIGTQGTGLVTISPGLVVSGNTNTTTLQLNGNEASLPPGGVLALTSTGQFFPTDVTAATTVYYLPTQAGENVPVYNGTHWQEYDIGSSGLSLSMTTTANFPTGETFDVYAFDNSGSVALCAIYWGGSTRSSTAGGKSGTQDVTLKQLDGLYTNNAAFASGNCYNNSTSYTPAANQATYLGSFHTSSAGQTEWKCHPAAASGGGAVDIAIYNVYNQRAYTCTNVDNGSQYTYSTATARISRNSTSNELHWLDGLGQSNVGFQTASIVENTSGCSDIGTALNSTSTPNIGTSGNCSTVFNGVSVGTSTAGLLGYNYYVSMEGSGASGTTTWNAGGTFGGFTNNGFLNSNLTVNGM